MKKNHFFTYSKLCVLALAGASALFLASCAEDGYDDESFDGGVSNTQVESISADDITITASADGKSQTISWPVVMGAGGYRVNLIDVSNPDEPIVKDSLVDGCSITAKREEDVNYQLTIWAMGNAKKNNTDATDGATKLFSTFTPTYATIPAGDIALWFDENPIPEDFEGDAINYDLEGGGEYTLSKQVDFGGHKVVIRGTNKNNNAKIALASGARFVTWGGFTLKYLDIDASQTNKPIVELGATPNDSIKNKIQYSSPSNYYFIMDPIVFQTCNVKGMGACLIADQSGNKYDIRDMLISNCVIEVNKTTNNVNANEAEALIKLTSGSFITNLVVENSTVYSLERGIAPFMTYNGRPKEIDNAELQKISFVNCTLYQLAYNTNFRGDTRTQGQTTNYFTVEKCIIVDCGKKNFCNALLRQMSTNPTVSYKENTYWWNGEDVSEAQTGDGADTTDTKLTDDPAFADPQNGDFTVGGAQQQEHQTGDPRWLP